MLEPVVPLYQPRAKTLPEMAEAADFFLCPDAELIYDPKAVADHLAPAARDHLARVRERLAGLAGFGQSELEAALQAYLEEAGVKFKLLAQPLRVALTGKTASPGLFETMAVLGRERVLARLDRAVQLN